MYVFSVEKGNREPIEADSLARELLETNKCYILDSGTEVFIWMGRNSSLDERKNSSRAAEVIPQSSFVFYFSFFFLKT